MSAGSAQPGPVRRPASELSGQLHLPPPPQLHSPPAGALIAAGQKIIDHVRDRKNAAPAGITRSQGGAAYADGRAKESESR